MSRSTFEYFTGEAAWAHRLFIPDEKYGYWSVNVKLDANERKRLKDCGSKLKVNEAGYIVFKRPTMKVWKGVETTLEPPVVLDEFGEPLGEDVRIGNGSTVTVKVEIYDYNYQGKPGKGTRLVGVRINDLIPYESPSSSSNADAPEPAANTAPPF